MYSFIRLISRLFCALPRSWSMRTGCLIGDLRFFLLPKHRAQSLKNLRLVFPDRSLRELDRIVLRSFRNFGMSIVETLRLPVEDIAMDGALILMEDPERFRQLVESRAIIVGFHTGNWELLNNATARCAEYAVVVRRQKSGGLHRFISELRTATGALLIPEDRPQGLISALKRGMICAVLFDHGSRNARLYATLFDKQVPVPEGVFRLARTFNRPLVPAAAHRDEKGRMCVRLFDPLTVVSSQDFSACAEHLHRLYEGYLREFPADYQWSYKRFKRARNRHVLILSDGKPGHVSQSRACAGLVERLYPGSVIHEVELGRLSGARRSLLDALAHISGRRMFGDTALLRRLCPGQAEELFRYADAVISTGSGLSSLNRILSYILDARSITVMRPNTAASRFDLIIVPEHDRVHGRSSVCRINGALVAQPSSGEYEQAGRLLRETFGLDAGERHAGVLIGGPVADGAYDERGAVVFLEAAAAAARAQGLRLLVTTSRRTPAAIESAVERIFATEPVCVIANRRNYPFAVRGIFACAHRVLVSADSVSMITESATSCDTGVCDLFNAAGATKHGRFVDRLVADGYAAAVTAGSVDGFLKDDRCFKRIDNESRVCEVLKRVLE